MKRVCEMGEKNHNHGVFSGEQKIPDSLKEDIRRFVHQAGMPYERVGETAEEAIRVSMEELTAGADPRVILFRTAARIIEDAPGKEGTDDLFRFDEDKQLHRDIRNLPVGVRLPFVLMKLHHFNSAEAGSVCRMTADEARAETESGYRILSDADPDRDLDRQLSLLRRAYGRIRYPEPEAEQLAPSANDQRTDRREAKRWWAAVAGLLAAVGLLIAAAFILPASAGPVDAAYIKKLEGRFAEEEARFKEKVGVTNMEMEVEFISIQEAEPNFKMFISKLDRAVQKGEAPTKKEVTEELSEILDVFDLPSEMAQQLSEQPIRDDKYKSREFVRLFEMRKNELTMVLSNRLMENKKFIEASINDGEFDKDGFFAKSEDYPEPLRHALQLMEQEGYELSEEVRYSGDQVYVIPNELPTLGNHADGLEESVAKLVKAIENVSLQKFSDHSPKKLAGTLIELEELALAQETRDPWREPEFLASYYFGEFVFGGESGRVFGDDGRVLSERRELWKQLAGHHESPSGKLLKPVIAEMEQTEWKRAKSYDHLQYESYVHALRSVREGHERYLEMDDLTSLEGSLGHSDFRVRTETLYQELSADGNRSLLSDSSPVMVAALALMAADRNDDAVMELLSIDESSANIKWLSEKRMTNTIEEIHLSFHEHDVVPHETGVSAPVRIDPFSGFQPQQIWLTYTPEGIWLVDRQDAQ